MQDAVRCAREIFPRLIGFAVIVDEHDLVVLVARVPLETFDAAREERDPITRRNDDADLLRLDDLALYMIGVRLPIDRNVRRLSDPREVFRDRVLARL